MPVYDNPFEGHLAPDDINDDLINEKVPESGVREKMTTERLKERLRDPDFLPTRQQITEALESEDLLGMFDFCNNKENPIYEFFNEEHLEALSDYFVERVFEYQATKEKPLVILEVGAGTGKLSHFLRQKLKDKAPNLTTIIATDSGEWDINKDYDVEHMNHQEALDTFKPDIVLFSWMPYEYDCTDAFRACKSVKEYILIGETDGGCCGADWETWGYSWDWSWNENEDEDEDETRLEHKEEQNAYEIENKDRGENEMKNVKTNKPKKIPPYEKDGFTRNNLDEISKYNICRTDYPGEYYHSETVCFKRK